MNLRLASWTGRCVRNLAGGAVLAAAAVAASSGTAQAQLTQVGGANAVYTSAPQGTDASFDPSRNEYLIVGGYTSVHAIFVNTAGQPITGLFFISGSGGFHPRVKYSQDLDGGQGGYLVAYHTGDPTAVYVVVVGANCRCVLTTPVQVSALGSNSLQGPGIAYSATSHVFLVTWTNFGNGRRWGAGVRRYEAGVDRRRVGT
jgi:hypothetical protein